MPTVSMTARYAGKCIFCGCTFPAGTEIAYDRESRRARHLTPEGCEAALQMPPEQPVAVGDLAGLLALFAKAQSAGLRYPKIRLTAPQSGPVVLSVAGAQSRAPGSVNVTDGRPYGANRWYGRISPSGAWELPRAGVPDDVQALVRDLAARPAAVASAHGHASGSCCFCARQLDDARSVAVGYGPICADRFGLPWGEDRETFVTKAA